MSGTLEELICSHADKCERTNCGCCPEQHPRLHRVEGARATMGEHRSALPQEGSWIGVNDKGAGAIRLFSTYFLITKDEGEVKFIYPEAACRA